MQRDEMARIIREQFTDLDLVLDERSRRLWAAAEAKTFGHGGQTLVSEATGISRSTIHVGLRELKQLAKISVKDSKRVRSPGGGRKHLTDHDPTLITGLEDMVDPTSRGDPESPLRWTCKSTRQLASALQEQGHKIGRQKVADLLADLGYSLQGNRKTKEGVSHPDRDAQFK